MKKILKLTAFSAVLLMLAGGLVSCNNGDNYNGEPEDPAEVPFVRLHTSNLCGVQLGAPSSQEGVVVIINNYEQLLSYIHYLKDDYPKIDFSTHSILFAKGAKSGASCVALTDFFQTSEDIYTLKTTICLITTATFFWWRVFVLVPKISDEAQINLEVEIGSTSFCRELRDYLNEHS